MNTSRACLLSIYLDRYLKLRGESRQHIAAWLLTMLAIRLAVGIPQEKQQLLAFIEAFLRQQPQHLCIQKHPLGILHPRLIPAG
ncbi:hypothetical protein ACFLU8_00740 [Chloroflexota bacterium]